VTAILSAKTFSKKHSSSRAEKGEGCDDVGYRVVGAVTPMYHVAEEFRGTCKSFSSLWLNQMMTTVANLKVRHTRPDRTGVVMMSPALVLLFVWMAVPLIMTFYFSVQHYNLMSTNGTRFVGFENYLYLLNEPGFPDAIINSLIILNFCSCTDDSWTRATCMAV
jgi:hypothetical protein